MRSFGDSGILLQLLVWIQEPAQRGLQTHNLIKMIHIAFKEQGIEIPFPQRDVNLEWQHGDAEHILQPEQEQAHEHHHDA